MRQRADDGGPEPRPTLRLGRVPTGGRVTRYDQKGSADGEKSLHAATSAVGQRRGDEERDGESE